MAYNDKMIWKVLDASHCSFRVALGNNAPKTHPFCNNPYNFNQICCESSCPLSNSKYATIREENGVCYLYMKTPERAHLPNKLWEQVKLSSSIVESLKQIDEELKYWPEYMIHRCKQRLVRIRQYLIRMRKLRKDKNLKELIPVRRKEERQYKSRYQKALKAADLDQSIKKELINRLKKGVYDEVYNDEDYYKEVLKETNIEEDEEDEEDEEGIEYMEYDSDLEEDSEEEEALDRYTKEMKNAQSKKRHIEIEYEKDQPQREKISNHN